MTQFFKQHMGILKSAKAITIAAIGVLPFLVSQMGYGGMFGRIGTLPVYALYAVGYFAGINVIDQLLSAKYVQSYRDMPTDFRRRWKVILVVLSIVSVASISGLIFSLHQSGN